MACPHKLSFYLVNACISNVGFCEHAAYFALFHDSFRYILLLNLSSAVCRDNKLSTQKEFERRIRLSLSGRIPQTSIFCTETVPV